MMRKVLSVAMALLLVCAMPLSVMADDWYLDNGDITISNTDGTQSVSQGGTKKDDNAPTIKQNTDNNSATSNNNSITVNTSGSNSASFTIENINTTGNIDVGSSNATITVEGTNTINTSTETNGDDAAIHVSSGDLTITGTGTLNVEKYGDYNADGAAIGSNRNEDMSGSITIGGSVKVEANNTCGSDGDGAAIGSGEDGKMRGKITIGENATVNATNEYGAAIGSGYNSDESGEMTGTITIGGNADVTATSKCGAAIGSGYGANMNGSITIQGNSKVTTTNGTYELDEDIVTGASIGSGGFGNMNGTIRIGSNVTLTMNGGTGIGTGTYGELGEKASIVYFEEPVSGASEAGTTAEEASAENETARTLYRVVDKDEKDLLYTESRKDGVLTVHCDLAYATFLAKTADLQTLQAQGIHTIVFETEDATSTFALEDLLKEGTGTCRLTHDGKTVTFTLDEADVSDILK